MPRSDYYERRAARIERLEERAAGKAAEARALGARASTMAEAIPFGQPILVGHHSEGRDRRYRDRIHRTFVKSAEAADAAEDLRARAAGAAKNRAVSSDAPDAAERLAAKVAKLEAVQAKMVAANRALRAGDDAALAALGFSPEKIAELKEPDFCGRTGFPDYATKNNGAEIRRLKKRLAVLEAAAERVAAPDAEVAPGVVISENTEANRLQVFFPGKPDEATRAALKARGFRWSPTEGAWQRLLDPHGGARRAAEDALRAAGVVTP